MLAGSTLAVVALAGIAGPQPPAATTAGRVALSSAVTPTPGAPRRVPRPPPAPPPRCTVPSGVASAQVVVVRSAGTTATVQACRRHQDGTYVRALGPYSGHVGYAGVAPVGAKREGDGRTPGGLFALRGGFGAGPNPGLLSGWFTVDARDVWVDDPGSSLYNTHQRTPAAGRWTSAESLAIPAYRYAQVIGYNESRRPGLGSAIFLHLDSGGATAGCVSVSESALLALLRWSRPNAVIAIS